MIVRLEGIQWEEDIDGNVTATVSDDALETLTVRIADNKISFHCDGTPTFDVNGTLDIAELCIALLKYTTAEHEAHEDTQAAAARDRIAATGPWASDAGMVPRQAKRRQSQIPARSSD
jgi:hypothetical protein